MSGDFLQELRDHARAEWKALGLESNDAPLDARPHVARIFSMGRGVPVCVWILGRTVRALARASTSRRPGFAGSADAKTDDMSFEEFLERGFPSDVASVLGDAMVADVRRAIEQLVALPCMCGTGAETVAQHGSIRVLASGQNPDAPVDDYDEIGFCTHCRRGWEFNACGDSHYSYVYDARPFDFDL